MKRASLPLLNESQCGPSPEGGPKQTLTSSLSRDLAKARTTLRGAFESGSPFSLTATGEQLLRDSGLKSYIDHRRDELTAQLRARAPLDLYTVQESAFRLFDRMSIDDPFARHLNKFAYRYGTSVELLRRVGAIYLRDIAVAPN